MQFSLASPRASVEQDDEGEHVKELVYHRQLLPAVERNADRTAFFDGEYTATFAEHFDRVGRLSAALDGIGVTRGDRFAVMALNSHQFLECYHAAFLGAGVINPLNLRLAPKELEYILGDSEIGRAHV